MTEPDDRPLISDPDPDNPWIALYSYAVGDGRSRIRYQRFPCKADACAWAKRMAPGWVGRNIMVLKVEACFQNLGVVLNFGTDCTEYDGDVF